MPRAQAALEFLTTYGWSLLITISVIGFLGYSFVSDPTKYLPQQCMFGDPLGPCDEIGTGTDGAKVGLTNSGKEFTVTGISANLGDCKLDQTNILLDGNYVMKQKWHSSEKKVLSIDAKSCDVSKPKKMNVTIKYIYSMGQMEHELDGELSCCGKGAQIGALSTDSLPREETVLGDPCTVDVECESLLCEASVCKADCSRLGNCNGQGTCTATNVCACNEGWTTRTDCSISDAALGPTLLNEPCAASNECTTGYCGGVSGSKTCTTGDSDKPCSASNECKTTFCSFSTNKCTSGDVTSPCTAASQCATGFCNIQSGMCQTASNKTITPLNKSCISSIQCMSGYCDLTKNTCADIPQTKKALGDSCTDVSECETGLRCAGNFCSDSTGGVGDTCAPNGCASGTQCQMSSQTCQLDVGLTCSTHSQCASEFCIGGLCAVEGLPGGSACGSGSECYSGECGNNVCFAGFGEGCTNYVCLPGDPCYSVPDSCSQSAGLECEPDTGTCAFSLGKSCASATSRGYFPCARSWYYCNSYSLFCTEGKKNEACGADGDCVSGKCHMSTHECENPSCTAGADCLSGFCDSSTQQCKMTDGVGSGCGTSADCVSGYICDTHAFQCKASNAVGTGCGAGSECASGFCTTYGNKCKESNAAGTDCTIGSECASGFCGTLTGHSCEGSNGDPCAVSDDCLGSSICLPTSLMCSDNEQGSPCDTNDDCWSSICKPDKICE